MKSAPNVEGWDYISYARGKLAGYENVFGKVDGSNDLHVETKVGSKQILSRIVEVEKLEGTSQNFFSDVPTVFYRSKLSKKAVKMYIDHHVWKVEAEVLRQEKSSIEGE